MEFTKEKLQMFKYINYKELNFSRDAVLSCIIRNDNYGNI